MSTKHPRLPRWLRRDQPPPPPATALPPLPSADVYQQILAQRQALVAQGQAMATLRATARICREVMASGTLRDEGLLPRMHDEMATLETTLAAFDTLWRDGKEALGLPELPELSAAEEADLRARLLFQMQSPRPAGAAEGG